MSKITPNKLREMLKEGFEELLRVLPEGNEAVLEIPSDVSDDPCVSFEAKTELEVLAMYVLTIAALRSYHSREVVRRIMIDEDGVQAILSGDTNYLSQKYLD